jgi:3-hydroxy-3-methylglutaryl CoA synthase
MVSISTVGGYVPLYRVRRATVAEQHGDSASGETAVPARDETLVTMASEAAGTALDRSDGDGDRIGAVFTATVTDPFAEHGIAAHVGYRHGVTGDVRTGDFQGSPRAATDALEAGRRYVQATGDRALVVGIDRLPVERGHEDEAYSGAGAGAILLAPADDDGAPAARIHGIGQRTTGFVERHREHGRAAESGDRRYAAEKGFGEAAPAAVTDALGTAPGMPDRAVIAVPDARVARNAMTEFPGDVSRVSTFDEVGYAGIATFYLDLVRLVEESDPDTTAVAVAHGAGGVDAVALTTGEGVSGEPSGTTLEELLDSKEYVTYAEHLRYRERIEYEGVVLE